MSDNTQNAHQKGEPVEAGWLKRIHWPKLTILVIVPALAFLMVPFVPLQAKTLVLSVVYYFITGIAITAGYHRLWAHRAYSASMPVRIMLAAFGAGAVEGTILRWSSEHRAHHRYTDTDQDPYNVKKGFLHAHILWLILRHPRKKTHVDMSDLHNDPVVKWQHEHYLLAMAVMAFGVPSLIAGLGWGDFYGGLLYAGILRYFFVNQATFCVNSLAHYLGEQPYGDGRSARNHLVTALITFGEGYHNFHHEFPGDYRNGIEWYDYDPTKWVIRALAGLGLVNRMKRFRQNEIEKRRVQQGYKALEKERARLDWGPELGQLPVMEWCEYQGAVRTGKALLVVEGVVHDVSGFMAEHPGGETMIQRMLGKDSTSMFNGGLYAHSDTARNVLSTMRVAVLRGGGEVEVWKDHEGLGISGESR
ncbi:putative acyl-CoA desaturase [Aspergillus heteromorphus CBS 117.55]|uniref:Acyl-CoA desaturase n=1 Tax=Aspergillus heteromorphus CBS 117.55 TaxID=1448321 RepID=A0A317WPD9_9EURO|nr:putative acyl-CoA desaturase [Aspergillus heteromorphus CBS 117.55]PWY88374.1 putative acyl-CoA desaturase [Aspergillus heteromorphus CBS 117.55]